MVVNIEKKKTDREKKKRDEKKMKATGSAASVKKA
jgi:hypothetical protein